MAFVPALIPLGVSLARINRNANDEGSSNEGTNAHMTRGRALVDKMVTGGAKAPITEWSEAKLEKAIRRNSVFRDHANELRLARVNGLLASTSDKAKSEAKKIAPVNPGQDTLSEADLVLLAADAGIQGNPSREARDAALELLADNSFDAILITDVAGIIKYSNKAFKALTGYDQADVIGKSPKILQGPGTDKKVLARLRECMQNGAADYEGSAINYKKDGTPFIMHWRVAPVKVDGKITAWMAIQREGTNTE